MPDLLRSLEMGNTSGRTGRMAGKRWDLERAKAARERAEERIHNRNDNLDLKRAEFALHKALIRINLAEYR